MDIKDNRELIRKGKEKKEANSETCRVCGSKKVHSNVYNQPTMDCIQYLRVEIQKLENGIVALRNLHGEIRTMDARPTNAVINRKLS